MPVMVMLLSAFVVIVAAEPNTALNAAEALAPPVEKSLVPRCATPALATPLKASSALL